MSQISKCLREENSRPSSIHLGGALSSLISLSSSYFFHRSLFSLKTMILILFLSPWLWQWEWCLQKPTTSYPEAEVLQFCFLPLPIEIRFDSLIFSFSHTLTCFFLLFKEVIGLLCLWKQMSANSPTFWRDSHFASRFLLLCFLMLHIFPVSVFHFVHTSWPSLLLPEKFQIIW